MAMSEEQLERWINQLIKDDQLYKFYKCKVLGLSQKR